MQRPRGPYILRVSVLCSSLLVPCLWAQVPQPAAVPGSGQPPGNCGIVCSPPPKAKIDLTAPAHVGSLGLIQGQPFTIAYTVTNTSATQLVGYVGVSGNGQPLPDARVGGGTGYGSFFLPSGTTQQQVTLAPQQQYIGMVFVNPAPSGDFAIAASYSAPPQCTGQVTLATGTKVPICVPGQRFATAATSIEIAPDADNDGLSDTLEQQLLTQYAPLMLFSRDHGSEEQYRPIDVIDYLAGSKLVSKQTNSAKTPNVPTIPDLDNAVLQKYPTAILGPDVTQPANYCILPTDQCDARVAAYQTVTMPLQIFVSPSDSAKHGSSWDQVLSQGNIGLYGHVVPVALSAFPDPSIRGELVGFMDAFYPGTKSMPSRYVLKVEFWQYFGYSDDFYITDYGNHDADWCSVQLYINPYEPVPDKAILFVYHYAHGIDIGFDFTQSGLLKPPMEFTYSAESTPYFLNPTYQIKEFRGEAYGNPVNFGANKTLPPYTPADLDPDTPCSNANDHYICNAQNNVVQLARTDPSQPYIHPVVYVEWGGHEFWPTKDWSFKGASKHGGDGYSYWATTALNVGEISHPMPQLAAQVIANFAGFWGYYGGFENLNPPPPGPPLHREWYWDPAIDPVSVPQVSRPF
jgi:hypothetical protein